MIKVALICEFNPFHNGHKLLFDKIREHFAPENVAIAAIMSGNYVQRGSLALFTKHKRASFAVDCGADIVFELPFPWSASYAQSFARAGVYIAESLGNVDYLAFGSETCDAENMIDTAEKLLSGEFEKALSDALSSEENSARQYAELRCDVFENLYGKKLSRKPNDILALEYLSAIKILESKIKPLFIKREVDFSATESRKCFDSENSDRLRELIPENIYEKMQNSPKFEKNLPDSALLIFLAAATPEKLAESPEMSFDLAYRLVNASKSGKYKNVSDLLASVATKKYTDARIRRALNFAFLGVKRADVETMPEYTNLLAMSTVGKDALREISKSAKIPVLSTLGAHNNLPENALKQYEISARADFAYSFCGDADSSEGNKPYIG